jgi:hypothetical protein
MISKHYVNENGNPVIAETFEKCHLLSELPVVPTRRSIGRATGHDDQLPAGEDREWADSGSQERKRSPSRLGNYGDPAQQRDAANLWKRRCADAACGDRESGLMIGLPAGTRIWIAAGVTDPRRGFDRCAATIQKWRCETNLARIDLPRKVGLGILRTWLLLAQRFLISAS